MTQHAPFSIEFIGRDGSTETKMAAVSTEQLALTNATLLKRAAPGYECIIRDVTGKAVHRF